MAERIVYDDAERTVYYDEGEGWTSERTEWKLGSREHNRTTIQQRAEQALTDLRAHAARTSFSNAQRDDALRLLCRVAIALVRLQLGRHEGTD